MSVNEKKLLEMHMYMHVQLMQWAADGAGTKEQYRKFHGTRGALLDQLARRHLSN